jgi:hypothetical protein
MSESEPSDSNRWNCSKLVNQHKLSDKNFQCSTPVIGMYDVCLHSEMGTGQSVPCSLDSTV